MKKLLTVFLFSCLLSPLFSQQTSRSWQNEIIVRLQQGLDANGFLRQFDDRVSGHPSFEIKKTLSQNLNIFLLENTSRQATLSAIEFLKRQNGVLTAQPNSPVQFRDSIPDDPMFSAQWDMERIGLPKVWEVSTGGKTYNGDEIVVAVLDKGFDLSHEEFEGNIWVNAGEVPGNLDDDDNNGYVDDINGWNFRDSSPFFNKEGHGTWVSGIIGAKGNNGLGLSGVNWNVKMMFLAVEFQDEVIAAFNYALEQRELYNNTNGQQGAFVVVTNGSFGIDGASCDSPLYTAWADMYDIMGGAGILSVAATANENWNVDEVGDIPTSCPSPYLITVTNSDSNDVKAPNAAFGKTTIDLAAPGAGTITTSTGNEFREGFSGTSSACPHVAGSVALLYSLPCADIADLALAQPSEAALLIKEAILKNVYPVSNLMDNTLTGGRLDVYESMKYLHSYCIGTGEERTAGNFKEVYFGKKGFANIYPNPISSLNGILTIQYRNLDFGTMDLRVFNSLGQEVQFPLDARLAPFEAQQVQLDVSNFPPGTYYLNLFDKSQKITQKFVVLSVFKE